MKALVTLLLLFSLAITVSAQLPNSDAKLSESSRG